MAVNALVGLLQLCMEENVDKNDGCQRTSRPTAAGHGREFGFVNLWKCFVGKDDTYMREGVLSSKVAGVLQMD